MSSEPDTSELLRDRLAERFSALLEILSAERDALLARAPEMLGDLVQRKEDLCGRIAEDQRLLLAGLRAVQTPPGWITELQALARRCQHENHLNGRIVNRARHTNRTLLRILTGEPPADLYQPPGPGVAAAGHPSVGQRLGSA